MNDRRPREAASHPAGAAGPGVDRAPRPRWLSGWRLFLLLTAAVLTAVLLARLAVKWQYEAERQAWADTGYPTSRHELWEWRGEREPGAADVYADAFEAYREERGDFEGVLYGSLEPSLSKDQQSLVLSYIFRSFSDVLSQFDSALSDDGRVVTEFFVQTHQRTRDHLHAAAAAGGGTMPYDRRLYQGLILSDLNDVVGAAKVPLFEAVLHADRGDGESAIAALEVASYLPAMLSDEMSFHEAEVQDRLVNQWAVAVRWVLTATRLDEAGLERIAQASDRVMPPLNRHHHMVPLAVMQALDGWDRDRPGGAGTFYTASGWREMELGYFLRYMREAAVPLAIDATPQRLEAVREYESVEHPAWADYPAANFPDLESLLQSRYEAVADLHASRVAVAVLRWHDEHGELPVTLDAVVPQYLSAIPEDPFTGEPLIYRVLEEGFVVYRGGGESESGPPPDDRAFRVRMR